MRSCNSIGPNESPSQLNAERISINTLLTKVRSIVRLVQRTFGIMEAILSLFYGALLGTVFSNYEEGPWWIITGVAASIIYLPLLIIKVRTQWILPDQIFEHLEAKIELNAIKQELARKEAIDGFIDQAIKTLNSATCKISSIEDALCESAMSDGISAVLSPLINRTQIVLDCNTAKFTVGALVRHYQKSNGEPEDVIEWLILRDDVGLGQEITTNPWSTRFSTGTALQIRQAFEIVLNENRIVECPLILKENTFQIVCSPIPLVCNESISGGVLCIIQECTKPPPKDVANILLIFGRIAANWLSKYDECIWNQYHDEKTSQTNSETSEKSNNKPAVVSHPPENKSSKSDI